MVFVISNNAFIIIFTYSCCFRQCSSGRNFGVCKCEYRKRKPITSFSTRRLIEANMIRSIFFIDVLKHFNTLQPICQPVILVIRTIVLTIANLWWINKTWKRFSIQRYQYFVDIMIFFSIVQCAITPIMSSFIVQKLSSFLANLLQ